MEIVTIRNVVFDIGNVLVKWSPEEIIRKTFGEEADTEKLIEKIFRNECWIALNKGELSEESAKQKYQRILDVKSEIIDELFYQIKDTQKPVEGTVDLLHRLSSSGYMLYALTDNVIEIVQYLKERYTFWEYFVGTVVSAEVNCMKPNPEIFLHLLDEYNILPDETVFIDDHMPNVESANNLGIHVVHFKDANECEQELKELGLVF